jgi:tRNA U55 pseudouridine synthase TruB
MKYGPLIVALLLASLGALSAADSKPNIILIYTDDHGHADLGIHGVMKDIKTPNLDALARSGEAPEMKPRTVTIHEITLVARPDPDHAEFSVTCGKGTYVRSLARDIAEVAGTVGYVSKLTRTRVGKFRLEDAISLDFLENLLHSPAPARVETVAGSVMPLSTVLDDIPALAVDEAQAARLRQGQGILIPPDMKGELFAVLCKQELIAIGFVLNCAATFNKAVFWAIKTGSSDFFSS